MRFFLGLLALVLAALYVGNASWRAPLPLDDVKLIAHRGVHQTYSRENLGNETCTAERINPPTHAFLENTIPSMQAAFAAGADIVELDVHPTTDGRFAVVHDWSVDCRTEGKGVTRELSLARLKSLDIGFGYTADGGKTFPFRGRGVGLVPSLEEVLEAMPRGSFLVNFKSNEEREAQMLGELLDAHPEWRDAIWGVYGGGPPTQAAARLLPSARNWTRRGLVDCLGRYVAFGWSGYIPGACRSTTVMVPINVAPWLWGWPHLFQQRMRQAGTDIILIGPFSSGDVGSSGIDGTADLDRIPLPFDGYVWTNKIEVVGPLLRR